LFGKITSMPKFSHCRLPRPNLRRIGGRGHPVRDRLAADLRARRADELVKRTAAKKIQIFCVQMIMVKKIVAGIQTLPNVIQPRHPFFIELGQAAEFHEV